MSLLHVAEVPVCSLASCLLSRLQQAVQPVASEQQPAPAGSQPGQLQPQVGAPLRAPAGPMRALLRWHHRRYHRPGDAAAACQPQPQAQRGGCSRRGRWCERRGWHRPSSGPHAPLAVSCQRLQCPQRGELQRLGSVPHWCQRRHGSHWRKAGGEPEQQRGQAYKIWQLRVLR